jgi:hypothetical protein
MLTIPLVWNYNMEMKKMENDFEPRTDLNTYTKEELMNLVEFFYEENEELEKENEKLQTKID